jgi:hypothetical protein
VELILAFRDPEMVEDFAALFETLWAKGSKPKR